MGGAGVSDYLVKETILNDPFKIDFFTLKNNYETKNFKKTKYGMIVYEYLKNNHLKSSLVNYDKKGYYEKLSNKNQITKSEIDKNRLSMLFIKKKKLQHLINSIKYIFQPQKSQEIINNINFFLKT